MRYIRLVLLTVSLLAATGIASAQAVPPTQVTPTNDTGVKAFETYGGAHENINFSNGNLSLNIPLLSLPGRNGLSLSLGIQYNSKIWSPHASYGSNSDLVYNWRSEKNGWPVGDMGWTFDLPFLHSGSIVTDDQGAMTGRTPSIITLPGGGKASVEYGMALTGGNFPMDSQDGSFVRLARIDATVDGTGLNSAVATMKDGTQIHFPCEGCAADQITDTNGNFITIAGNNITDTAGRLITITEAGAYPSRTITISYKDSNGTPQSIVLTLSAITLFQTTGDATTNQYYTGATPFQYPQPSGNATSASHVWVFQPPSNAPYVMLTRIDLPGDMSYTFSYNGYGELIRINYPSGGYTKYAYAAFQHGELFWTSVGRIAEQGGLNIKSDFRELVSKRVCRNATGGCTQYAEDLTSYGPTIASTSNLNNDSVEIRHFLDEASNVFEKTTVQFTNDTILDNNPQYYTPRETLRSTYTANGALLRSVQTAYNVEPDFGYANLPASVTTTLYDVNPPLVTKTETQYDTYAATVRWPPITADSTYQLQTIQARTRLIDNPTKQTGYDFGPNALGNRLRIVNTTWWKTAWANHLWNRPLTQEIQDGGGIRAAYTQFEYDNYTEPVAVSHATQLAACSGTACTTRGNQTAVSHWRNTDGVMLTTRSQFDDAGNVLKVTDPLGHVTTFSYADNWTDGNTACVPASGSTAAYPTLVQNHLGHQSVTTYNSCTGTVASQIDANQQKTTTTHDAQDRPLKVSYPDGGQTIFDYHANALPLKVTKTVVNAPNPGIITSTLQDGLGREVQSSLDSSPGGPDVVDIAYDTRGRELTRSNPHRAAAAATDGITTYQYDALSRVIQVAPPDGTPPSLTSACLANNVCTQYSGQATTVTDQAGNQRRTISDGLGRLVEVDEPGSQPPPQSNYATLQTDGNFVLYKSAGVALWSAGTAGTNSSSMFMQDNGNLVLYIFKWQAGTSAAPSPGPFPAQGCRIGSYLVAGQRINASQCLVSPLGQYLLYMATDGNFYIYDMAHGTVPWAANTYGHPGAYATLQADGNFVVYDVNNIPLWNSATYGTYAERLNMEDDGRIILYKSSWNSGTATGQISGTQLAHPACDAGAGLGQTGSLPTNSCLVSPNGHFELLMQPDGNLVILDRSVTPAVTLWATGTAITAMSPGYVLTTLYQYDTLNDLLCVEQHGSASGLNDTGCSAPPASDAGSSWRVRRFTYDSLSRLLTAKNPESGQISYVYDDDGNLLMKTSPAPNQLETGTATQTVSYCYDGLHRLTMRDYQAHTYAPPACPITAPVVSYIYCDLTHKMAATATLCFQS